MVNSNTTSKLFKATYEYIHADLRIIVKLVIVFFANPASKTLKPSHMQFAFERL